MPARRAVTYSPPMFLYGGCGISWSAPLEMGSGKGVLIAGIPHPLISCRRAEAEPCLHHTCRPPSCASTKERCTTVRVHRRVQPSCVSPNPDNRH